MILMIKNLTILALFFAVIGFNSCKETKKEQFHITGSYTHADQPANAMPGQKISKVSLEEITYGKDQAPLALDSAVLSSNSGEFSLNAVGKSQGVYELIFGDNLQPVPLINDAPEINY
jgi:hypothetical protein